MYQLTSQQWDTLIDQYVGIQVDSMDTNDLVAYVTQTMTQDLREIESRSELCDEIKYTFDQELLDELVDNVTQQYAQLPNTFGG